MHETYTENSSSAETDSTREQENRWLNVYRAVESLNMPLDTGARAMRVGAMETGDYIAATAVLHSLLASDADINPSQTRAKMVSPQGDVTRELAQPQERLGIFERAAELVQVLAKKADQSEARQFLDRAANLAALAVVLAHPYEDGNGRTARVLAHIIKSGFDGSPEIQGDIMTLGTNRTFEGFRIGSFMPGIDSHELSALEILERAAGLDIPLQDEKTYVTESWKVFNSPYNPSIGPEIGS